MKWILTDFQNKNRIFSFEHISKQNEKITEIKTQKEGVCIKFYGTPEINKIEERFLQSELRKFFRIN